jgi:glutamyl/glutaminyl-tRNA synthetase
VVRFEDIDRPRVLAGAQEAQLKDLERLGLHPDFLFQQSAFRERHLALFLRGVSDGQIYACDCSRKEVQEALQGLASAPHAPSPVYSGHCRIHPHTPQAAESLAWRFRMPADTGVDDFIVARSGPTLNAQGRPVDVESFVPAYHWACAIDDFDGGHLLLVRSSDLRPALQPQRAIQEWLGRIEGRRQVPAVFHTSLIVQDDGHRLEKRTLGVTLDELIARGVSVNELLERFESSFDRALLRQTVSQGAVLTETQPVLRLNQLMR